MFGYSESSLSLFRAVRVEAISASLAYPGHLNRKRASGLGLAVPPFWEQAAGGGTELTGYHQHQSQCDLASTGSSAAKLRDLAKNQDVLLPAQHQGNMASFGLS